MEHLSQWFHRIMESYAWKSVLGRFQGLDWLVVILLVIGMVCGMKKGLLRELVEIFELGIIITLVFEYYPGLASILRIFLAKLPGGYPEFLAFIFLTALVWFAVRFLDGLVQKWIETKVIAPLRIAGGALLGAAHAFLMLSFFAQALLLLPSAALRRPFEPGNSRTGHWVAISAPAVYELVMKPLQRSKA